MAVSAETRRPQVFSKPGVRENLSIPDQRKVAEGLLRALLRKMGMTVDEFLQRVR